ncbi:MAG: SemiSWEET transporter [Leptolyngbyaceae bacterium]|nr:SemiSWEET transporter [Leptolyngbyaceae bacterium]
MNLVTALGLMAGTLTTAAYLPQLIKTWRSKSAGDISWSMLITLCLGIVLWLVYGVYVHDVPVILANVLTLLLTSFILILKIRYRAPVNSLTIPQSSLVDSGMPIQ